MHLSTPLSLGPLQLANRVVMAPMTRSRAIGGVPNELMREYYTQRASAGLIVTEGTAPSPNGLGYARIPGLYSSEQVEGWSLVTASVRAAGGQMIAQLMHTGRIAHPANLPPGARVLAPSALRAEQHMYTDELGPQPLPEPEEMSDADLRQAREEFVRAAVNAIKAGFVAVELHAANGYLLEQFLHPHTNRRQDQYGGSAQNRARFVVEVADAVGDAIGRNRVGIRLSPFSTLGDLPAHAEVAGPYAALAESLRGLLYIHLVENQHAAFEEAAGAIRRAFDGTLIRNGAYDADRAEAAIAEGRAELISFGRPFIANPDLVMRLRTRAALATPDHGTFYTPGAQGYTDYAPLSAS